MHYLQASYILNVRIHSYSGDDKCPECYKFISPGCCDDFDNTRSCEGLHRCDITFFYCLRDYGTVPSQSVSAIESCMDRLGMRSGVNIDNQQLDFTQESVMGLPNPIPLFGTTLAWQVRMMNTCTHGQPSAVIHEMHMHLLSIGL